MKHSKKVFMKNKILFLVISSLFFLAPTAPSALLAAYSALPSLKQSIPLNSEAPKCNIRIRREHMIFDKEKQIFRILLKKEKNKEWVLEMPLPKDFVRSSLEFSEDEIRQLYIPQETNTDIPDECLVIRVCEWEKVSPRAYMHAEKDLLAKKYSEPQIRELVIGKEILSDTLVENMIADLPVPSLDGRVPGKYEFMIMRAYPLSKGLLKNGLFIVKRGFNYGQDLNPQEKLRLIEKAKEYFSQCKIVTRAT